MINQLLALVLVAAPLPDVDKAQLRIDLQNVDALAAKAEASNDMAIDALFRMAGKIRETEEALRLEREGRKEDNRVSAEAYQSLQNNGARIPVIIMGVVGGLIVVAGAFGAILGMATGYKLLGVGMLIISISYTCTYFGWQMAVAGGIAAACLSVFAFVLAIIDQKRERDDAVELANGTAQAIRVGAITKAGIELVKGAVDKRARKKLDAELTPNDKTVVTP